jgi:16S rRNA (cytosine967-C5)-methyltransferase
MPTSPARVAAFDILLRVAQQNAFASELLHSDRLSSLSVQDRALATELCMGVLRWRSQLDELIAKAAGRALTKVDPEVLTALRLGAYQLRFLSRIPAHAAINDGVELVKRAHKRSAAPFANAVLRKISAAKDAPSADSTSATPAGLAHEFAHPEWLIERWIAALGAERTRLICTLDQQVPRVGLRMEDAAAEEELRREGIELAPGALLSTARVLVRGSIFDTAAVREGRVFIQDEASQLVAALIGTGTRILDCCAAPGGKTAAIAARNPTAEIVAAELHAHRAELLRRRVHSPNVQVIQADVLTLAGRGEFDRVLADVPCSGTGTLARNPEIKWRLDPDDLADLHARQVALLRAALAPLAPGGRAVYSTCSLEREENEDVVDEVLRNAGGYRLLDCRERLEQLRSAGELVWQDLDSLVNGVFLRTIPGLHPCDGFFAAIFEREPA